MRELIKEVRTTKRFLNDIPGGICRLNDQGCDCYLFDKQVSGKIARGGFWYLWRLEMEDDSYANDFDYVYNFKTGKTFKIIGGK